MVLLTMLALLGFSPQTVFPIGQHEFREQTASYTIKIKYPEIAQAPHFNAAVHQIVSPLVSNFENGMRESPDDGPPGELDGSYTVATLKSGIVSVLLEWGEYYPGAAHTGGGMASVNYDSRTGRVLALSDLFRPGVAYVSRVSQLAIASLERKEFADRDSVREGAGPKASNFKVFTITDTALVLHFPTYQVAAGAAGAQTVYIPLETLAPWLGK